LERGQGAALARREPGARVEQCQQLQVFWGFCTFLRRRSERRAVW
jgi:hypothetical protein